MGGVWDIYLLMIYSTRTPRCSTSMTHMEMSGVEVKCEGKPHCNTSDSIRSSCRLALRQPVPSSKPLRPLHIGFHATSGPRSPRRIWTSTATNLRSIGPSKTSQRTPSSAWIHCNPSPDLDLAPKPPIGQLLLHAPTPFHGTRYLTYTSAPTRPVCDASLMIARLAQVDGTMHCVNALMLIPHP